ncbi:TraX family protein [Azohydromonas aeria]|uniref:TraX family protein n=1 Tax=Azohydromonas aeria TaxID=2590212 RepID=UPI0012F71A0E|nr:TraX family protein [Azohydromonas aeria]
MSAILKGAGEAPRGGRQWGLPAGCDESLKWLALGLMVLDHVNTYLLDSAHPWAFAAGRTVMPIFSTVLAYNLARGRAGAAWRTSRRALAFGLLALPATWALHGAALPLNIMFTLSASAAAIALLEQQRWKVAMGLAFVAGVLCEGYWPVIGTTVAAWYFWRSPSWRPAVAWLLCMLALTPINGNCWAFAAVPVIAAVAMLKSHPRRVRWLFYVAYPLHLSIIWGIK